MPAALQAWGPCLEVAPHVHLVGLGVQPLRPQVFGEQQHRTRGVAHALAVPRVGLAQLQGRRGGVRWCSQVAGSAAG